MTNIADSSDQKFEGYIADIDIEENSLQHHPVPSNIQRVKVVVDFLWFILSQNSLVISQDSSMENFQQSLCDVMDPLTGLWKSSEGIKWTVTEEIVSVPTEEYIKLVEQSVLLLGQAFNTIMYGRQLNILKPLTKDLKKAKHIMLIY